jgi:hypothetical protein
MTLRKWQVNIVAIVKHIAIKNSNYDAAVDYLTMQHDEFTNKAILDKHGHEIPRDFYLLNGINCSPYSFYEECQSVNARYGKNQTRSEIKAHHYIISFDPRDRDENGLTPEKAQELGMAFARKNFPGHQLIVCTHRDGHNSAGNIHVHIVLNSVRKLDVPMQDFMERPGDAMAGHKHHVTKPYLEYLKQETMNLCQKENFYQVDLLSPAKIRITDREYWAKRRAQAKLDQENAAKKEAGIEPSQTVYRTKKDLLRARITVVMKDSHSFEEFEKKLLEEYGITVHVSRGRLSYLPADQSKPIRARMLGTNFEKEYLEAFFRDAIRSIQPHVPTDSFIPNSGYHPAGKQTHFRPQKFPSSYRKIVDISTNAKAQASEQYANAVKVSNLRQLSLTKLFLDENGIKTAEEMNQLVAATKADVDGKLAALKATEAELRRTNLLIRNTGQYLANKSVYRAYLNAPDKKQFRKDHEPSLLLYESARKELRSLSGGRKIPLLKQLKKGKQELVSRKNTEYEDYSFARAKYRELLTIQANREALYGNEKEQTLSQSHERES